MNRSTIRSSLVLGMGLFLLVTAPLQAGQRQLPPSLAGRTSATLPPATMPAVDLEPYREADALRDRLGVGPFRFAAPIETGLDPAHAGRWERLPDGSWSWRLAIRSTGATSLNLALRDVRLPGGTLLWFHDGTGAVVHGPFGPGDLTPDGQLWTPIVPGDEAILEAWIPSRERSGFGLAVFRVNHGYRAIGGVPGKSGSCNVDVVCPEGDPWRAPIRSVAWYTLQGWGTCSGYLVNNARRDGTPYFLTADHCGVREYNADTMVFYWNDQSPTCGQHGGGTLTDTQSGAIFRSTWERSDTTLVELEERPDPEYGVFYMGFDATGATPSTGIVGIHHPNLDEKSISYDTDSVATDEETYWRVQWDVGTTEGGSSGSLVMDRARGLAIGVLTGGYASCQARDGYDYYSKLAAAWTGGGTPSTSVSPWLDPGGTGALVVPGMEPDGTPWRQTWWVPVVISAPGAAGSLWRTDVTVLDLGTGPTDVTFTVHLPGGDRTLTRTLAAGEQTTLEDIVALAGGEGKGTLEITATEPLGVTARLYDDTGAGTFGQFERGSLDGGGLLDGGTALLAGLRQDDGLYRTNLQVANTGRQEATVRVTLVDTSGLEVANYDLDIAPGTVVQDLKPFSQRAGQPHIGWGYATVEVLSGTGILPTASVIDERTNDAVTVEPAAMNPVYRMLPDGDESRWLPVVAHLDGAAGSHWRSSVAIVNRGTFASSATLHVRLDDETSWPIPLELPPGAQATWDDLLAGIGADGKGTLEVDTASGLAITGRLYNESAAGTFGQAFGSLSASEAGAAGAELVLPGLREEENLWRTNLTFANAGTDPATVAVTLLADSGTVVGSYTLSIPAGQVVQDIRPFAHRANEPDLGWGYARVRIASGKGVLVSASVIDSRTNDATTVLPLP